MILELKISLQKKVALTNEDIDKYDLPSDMDAKVTSANYEKFIERYGSDRVVELDAAPLELLQEKLREAIEDFLDMDEFNAQKELQNQEAVELQAYRSILFNAVGKLDKWDLSHFLEVSTYERIKSNQAEARGKA